MVAERPTVTEDLDTEDGKLAHIVLEGFKENDGDKFISAKDAGLPGGSVVESRILGTIVKALCGYEFSVSEIKPNRPVCPACAEIAKGLGWNVPV